MTEIKKRLFSIIYLLVFLGITTWFFYGPRKYLSYIAINLNKFYTSGDLELNRSDIKFGSNDISVKNRTDKEVKYIITMNNDYNKLRSKSCKIMSNNYLSYHITDNKEYDIERVLSTDGIIYRGVLKPREEQYFNLDVVEDIDNENDKFCFYPILHASVEDR